MATVAAGDILHATGAYLLPYLASLNPHSALRIPRLNTSFSSIFEQFSLSSSSCFSSGILESARESIEMAAAIQLSGEGFFRRDPANMEGSLLWSRVGFDRTDG